jgi:undecaprenyl-diphosphatase
MPMAARLRSRLGRIPAFTRLPRRLRDLRRDRLGRDAALILGGLFLLFLCHSFLELADDVEDGETHGTDMAILLALREPDDPREAIGPEWLESGVRDVTALGSAPILIFVTLAACGFLFFRRQVHGSFILLLSMAGGLAASIGLKGVFARPRPDLVEIPSYVSHSFPSGHSMMSAVVYLTLGFIVSRFIKPFWFKAYVLFLAVGITFVVGLSRIFLGVHYPSDVVAGWMAGLAWAGFCLLIAEWLQGRGRVEPEK